MFSPTTGLRDLDVHDLPASDDPPSWWVLDSVLLADRVRESTVDFLNAVHPDDAGFLELRAFDRGATLAPQFVALPLTAASLTKVQTYARQAHRLGHNVYHAVATRGTAASGKLDNCTKLWALYIEIDFKRHVPLQELWSTLTRFPLPASFVVHSGGGLHVYWLLSEPLDLTSDLGLARAYQWLGDLAQRLGGEPESTEPARVLRLPDTLNRKAEYGPTAPVVTILCADSNARYSLDQFVAILGDADPTRPAASIVTPPTPIDHGLDQKTRQKLARTWLERQPPAVEGQGGDALTFRVCCDTVIGHDLDEREAVDALRDWNARCEPPWPVSALLQKVRNAVRYGKGQRGAKLVEFPMTEVGDAECFADQYADIVRYDHRQGRWLLTDDVGVWEHDPTERLHRLVTDMMRRRQDRANLLSGDDKKKYWKWAVAGESRKRITNTLALAQAIPPLADRGDGWDPDPMLLGTSTGVIDLRTGTLRLARPEDRVTLRLGVRYDPAATCPLWEKTIAEIFNDDADLVAFIQRALGYSLTGDCREECFFINWGGGANGKGTLMNTFTTVLGDYHDNLSFSALELHTRSAAASPELAKLVGRRFVTASETSDDVHLNEARIKALTGRDPLTARFLYQNEFTFDPVAKFWLATNAKPRIRDASDGFWRRIHMIPFTQSFLDARADRTLKDRLKLEGAGILNWAIRGCLKWQQTGLAPVPDAVRAATEAYRRESEQLSRWIEACCEIRPDGRLQAAPAFDHYRLWCDRQREQPNLNLKTFGQKMQLRYPPDATNRRNTVYVGIALRMAPPGSPF
jgi:putative DNA primase/helicase